jgi:alkyl hydroperoxide reductase subunit AhpC
MALHIGEEAPNFTAESTEGTINFHDWIGNSATWRVSNRSSRSGTVK